MDKQNKTLAVFDMDFTISQDYLEECLFETMDRQVYKDKLQRFYKQHVKWPTLLKQVLTQYPPQPHLIQNWLHKTQSVPGMQQLFTYLTSNNHELILLSGGNSHCAERFLEIKGFRKYFSHIFAPKLTLSHQPCSYEDKITSCHLNVCHHGFCKGVALDQYFKDNQFQKVMYFGDGNNDLCGMHKVNQGGAVFIRKEKYLHKKIQEDGAIYEDIIKCKNVVYWQDGHEVLSYLKKENIA